MSMGGNNRPTPAGGEVMSVRYEMQRLGRNEKPRKKSTELFAKLLNMEWNCSDFHDWLAKDG
jgi:hypothetical protein